MEVPFRSLPPDERFCACTCVCDPMCPNMHTTASNMASLYFRNKLVLCEKSLCKQLFVHFDPKVFV